MPCRIRKKIRRPRFGAVPHKKGTGGKQGHASHVIVLATEDATQPGAERKDHRIGHQVAGQDPGRLVDTGSETAGDVGQRDVGDAGIQQFHESRDGQGQSDPPGIHRATAWSDGMAHSLEVSIEIRWLRQTIGLLRRDSCPHLIKGAEDRRRKGGRSLALSDNTIVHIDPRFD